MKKRRFVSTIFAAISTIATAVTFTPVEKSATFYKEDSSGEQIFVGESDSARIRVVFNLNDEPITNDVQSIDCYLVSDGDTIEIDRNSPVLTVGPNKCYHVMSKTIGLNNKVLKSSTSHLCYVKKKSVAPTLKVCDYDTITNFVCGQDLKVKFFNLDYVNTYVDAKGNSRVIEDNIVLTYIDYEADGLTIKEKQMEFVVDGVNKDTTWFIQKPKRNTVFKIKDKLTEYVYISDTFHTTLPFSTAQISIDAEAIPHNTEKRSDEAIVFGSLEEAKSNVGEYLFSGPLKITLERNSVDNSPIDTIVTVNEQDSTRRDTALVPVDAKYTWKFYNDSTGTLKRSTDTYSGLKLLQSKDIDEYGTHFIILTCDNGVCKDTLVAGFKVTTSYLDMPSVFTPNGDGYNDEFRPTYTSIREYNIWIYNTMGKEMYSSKDITVGWDGTYKGKDSPIGAYYYVVKATGVDGIEYKLKGTVNLVRHED